MGLNDLSQWIKLTFLLLVCISSSGCMLLALPAQLIGGTFGLIGQAFQLAQTVPTPPAWMFF